MATVLRHFNPKTGKVMPCQAHKGNCPLAKEFGEDLTHHGIMNDEEAREFEGKLLAEQFDYTSGLKKTRGRPVSEDTIAMQSTINDLQSTIQKDFNNMDFSGQGSKKYLDILNGEKDPNSVGFTKMGNAYLYAASKRLDNLDVENKDDALTKISEANNLVMNAKTAKEKREAMDKVKDALNNVNSLSNNNKKLDVHKTAQLSAQISLSEIPKVVSPEVKEKDNNIRQAVKTRKKSAKVQAFENSAVEAIKSVNSVKSRLGDDFKFSRKRLDEISNFSEAEMNDYVSTTPWKQVCNDMTAIETEMFDKGVKDKKLVTRSGKLGYYDTEAAKSLIERNRSAASRAGNAEEKQSFMKNHKLVMDKMNGSMDRQDRENHIKQVREENEKKYLANSAQRIEKTKRNPKAEFKSFVKSDKDNYSKDVDSFVNRFADYRKYEGLFAVGGSYGYHTLPSGDSIQFNNVFTDDNNVKHVRFSFNDVNLVMSRVNGKWTEPQSDYLI